MSHIAAGVQISMGQAYRVAAHRVLGALLAVGCLWGSTEARGQGLEKAVLDRAKDATVYVKIKVNGQPFSVGSGFVVKVMGDTVLVMTNRHVAVEHDEPVAKGNREIFVVFRSQTPQEQELPAKLLTFDHRYAPDLAMLEIKGVRQPPAEILAEKTVKESDLYETMPAYSLGFPASAGLIGAKDFNFNPAVTVNSISISAFRRSESGRLERFQYAGSAIGGNSGGPVINDKGLLVGVVVERVPGENVGRAIPPNVIAGFLGGDVDINFGGLMSWSGTTAKMAVGGRLVDPYGKVRSMSARYLPQSALPTLPKPDIQGHYPIMPNSKTVLLQLRPSTSIQGFPTAEAAGYAEVDIPIATPDDRKLYFQVVVTDSFGRTYANKPVPTTIPDKPETYLHPFDKEGSSEKAPTLAQWSCEANLAEGIKMKHTPGMTTITMPEGVALNHSPQNNLYNAPCALVRVDGDFVARVEVENTFDPGGQGAILPNGRKSAFSFQSAGLLIWQDEKNFVRLERAKGSDGGISMIHQVLIEIYRTGQQPIIAYLPVSEQQKMVLAVIRKGGSLQLLFGSQSDQLKITQELAVDFDKQLMVGVAATNLSKRGFQAKLANFDLKSPDGLEIAAKPYKMKRTRDTGIERLTDGTLVFEGSKLATRPLDAPVIKQDMAQIKEGVWSDDRQLLWNIDKGKKALTLELPVEATGKYEIRATFTKAPDYGKVKLDLGTDKPLNKGAVLDLYSPEIKPSEIMSLGIYTLSKGKVRMNITNYDKNPKSSGYHVGIDEVRLVPVK